MKYTKLLMLALIFFMLSCEKQPFNIGEPEDTSPPEIFDFRWLDRPSIKNDVVGDIEDGEHYTIYTDSGFQYVLKIRDQSNLKEVDVYFLVNNDETKKETLSNKQFDIPTKDISFGYLYDIHSIVTDSGVYKLKAGDKLHFYLHASDELDHEVNMQWTADLVE